MLHALIYAAAPQQRSGEACDDFTRYSARACALPAAAATWRTRRLGPLPDAFCSNNRNHPIPRNNLFPQPRACVVHIQGSPSVERE
jgi:hypothetical protein